MASTYPAYLEAYEERPRRRGRRLLITMAVLLAVLLGLLLVADRAAAGYAERRIADQASQQLAEREIRSSPPEVTVGGFPFLTQVVTGDYELISIRLRDVHTAVDGDSIVLPRLDVDARGVNATVDTLRSGQGEIRADTVQGTGTIGYDSVEKLVDQPGVRFAEADGKLKVNVPLEVLGQRFTATGTGQLAVAKGVVQIRFDELAVEGVPDVAVARRTAADAAKQISIDIPLPDLPYGLTVQQVRVLPEGLVVTARANDVPLNQGAA